MLPVPAGVFRMGSLDGRDDERPLREARVSAFALARTPTTRREYAPFLDAGLADAPPWWSDPAHADPDLPVVGVTWHEAMAFAAWLSRACGGCWRLPTEAEWERAARGGLEGGATAWGAHLPDGEVPQAAVDAPWRAGRGTPNGYGLCDMGTIVHEWCADWYDPAQTRRSSRGGSWRHHVRWSGPASRSSLPPGLRYADYGFRVLREEGA